MADMYSISSGIREIILMQVYLLLLVQFGCIFAAAAEKERYLLKYILPSFTAVCVILIWLQYINRRIQTGIGIPDRSRIVWFHKIPAVFFFILICMFFIYTACLLMKIRRYYQNTVTEFSIKESIDNLPSGLSFSSLDGFILLANRRMESLCYAITGLDFQDAENFWRFLSEGKPGESVQRLSDGKTPVFQLPDKTLKEYGENIEALVRNREILET